MRRRHLRLLTRDRQLQHGLQPSDSRCPRTHAVGRGKFASCLNNLKDSATRVDESEQK